MHPPPRSRETVKWSGVALTAILALMWAASARWTLWSTAEVGSVQIAMGVRPGFFVFQLLGDDVRYTDRFKLERARGPFNWSVWSLYAGRRNYLVMAPLWAPLLVSASLTATVVLRARRARGRCHNGCPCCNYDRTGLAATVPCPECGGSLA